MIHFVWLNTQDCQVYSWLQVLHVFMVCQPITINSTHIIHYETSTIKWCPFFFNKKNVVKIIVLTETLPAKFQNFNKILLWLTNYICYSTIAYIVFFFFFWKSTYIIYYYYYYYKYNSIAMFLKKITFIVIQLSKKFKIFIKSFIINFKLFYDIS